MTNIQIWTMIGSFSALMVGGFGMMAWLIRSEIDGLRGQMNSEVGGLRGQLHSEISGLRNEMNARFADVEHRLDAAQADMHLVKSHLIGKIPA